MENLCDLMNALSISPKEEEVLHYLKIDIGKSPKPTQRNILYTKY